MTSPAPSYHRVWDRRTHAGILRARRQVLLGHCAAWQAHVDFALEHAPNSPDLIRYQECLDTADHELEDIRRELARREARRQTKGTT